MTGVNEIKLFASPLSVKQNKLEFPGDKDSWGTNNPAYFAQPLVTESFITFTTGVDEMKLFSLPFSVEQLS